MTSKKAPIPFSIVREITMYELPAFEKNGCIGQPVPSLQFVTIRFQDDRVEVVQLNGLPHVFDGELSRFVSGVNDAVLVGVPWEEESPRLCLIDAAVVSGKSVSMSVFRDRLEMLKRVYEHMNAEAKKIFWLAEECTVGLVGRFMLMSTGLRSMLIRPNGKESVFVIRK